MSDLSGLEAQACEWMTSRGRAGTVEWIARSPEGVPAESVTERVTVIVDNTRVRLLPGMDVFAVLDEALPPPLRWIPPAQPAVAETLRVTEHGVHGTLILNSTIIEDPYACLTAAEREAAMATWDRRNRLAQTLIVDALVKTRRQLAEAQRALAALRGEHATADAEPPDCGHLQQSGG